VNWKKKEIN